MSKDKVFYWKKCYEKSKYNVLIPTWDLRENYEILCCRGVRKLFLGFKYLTSNKIIKFISYDISDYS